MRALRAQKRPVEALNGPFQPDSVPVICRSSPFAEFFITLLALLIIGLAPGAILGISTRTHEWLEADPRSFVYRWQRVGLDKKEVAQRLLDQIAPPGNEHPLSGSVNANNTEGSKDDKKQADKKEGRDVENSSIRGSLFVNFGIDGCIQLRSALTPVDRRRFMRSSPNLHVRQFEAACKDDAVLQVAIKELICPDTPGKSY
jgi:hypothetical protein